MEAITASDRVKLLQDLPEMELHRGDVGVVREAWFYPNTAYEVEFPPARPNGPPSRMLLLDDQVALSGR